MAKHPLRASDQLLQGGFIRKTSFKYHIHGYRYAPESFHIYKGLPGQEETEPPLSGERHYQMRYLYLTQGIRSAIDYMKHIERERERKCRLYMTYGFMLKENLRNYVYCADLQYRENDPPAMRLQTLRAFRERLAQNEGRVEQNVECGLDERYHPIRIRKNYMTTDFSRPTVAWLNIRQKEKKVKQIGNLAIVYTQWLDVLMQIYDEIVSIHADEGPEQAILSTTRKGDDTIQDMIGELDFGRCAAHPRKKEEGATWLKI